MIKITRNTTESNIIVTIEKGPIAADYRSKINTPIPFLNHMIEHIVWRSGINITVEVTLDRFDLAHVVCEDVGMTIGKGILEYIQKNGATGYGDGIGIIDEALALCAISFEGRSQLFFDKKVAIPAQTELVNSEDVETFLEGFVQGACCTFHVILDKGENGHHIWEAIYRAFGIALGRTLVVAPDRAGMTAGVAGKIDYQVEA